MKQSKLMSLAEALLNVAIGYIIAVATQLLVFPIFGLQVSITDNLLIGAFFTVVSIARSFAVRRLFEAIRIFKKETDK